MILSEHWNKKCFTNRKDNILKIKDLKNKKAHSKCTSEEKFITNMDFNDK